MTLLSNDIFSHFAPKVFVRRTLEVTIDASGKKEEQNQLRLYFSTGVTIKTGFQRKKESRPEAKNLQRQLKQKIL